MLALGFGLALVGAIAIAEPVSRLVLITSGEQPGWVATVLWTFVVLAVAVVIPLVILSNRPAHISLDAGLIRVGWRTVPFGELRHVYRLPGGTRPDQFVLQLELLRGLDARLPIASTASPNLSVEEIEVVLEMVRRAPIEPKSGVPVRSPLGDELGARGDAERIADEVSDALQPFGRVSYSKPTLLRELEVSIARRRRVQAPDSPGEPLPGDRLSGAGLAVEAISTATPSTLAIMPGEAVGPTVAAPEPTGRYSEQRRAVEEWIAVAGSGTAPGGAGGSFEAATVNTYSLTRVLGWVIIVVALSIPWILTFLLFKGYLVSVSMPLDAQLGWWSASLLTWPFGVWLGLVVLMRSTALRMASGRRAAVQLRSRGTQVPGFVADFFGSTQRERMYGVQVYLFGLTLSIAFLASGLVFLALSAGTVGGPYAPLAWHAPLGWLLLVPAIPVFVGVLRWQRYMHGQLARASVEWGLLGNSSGQVVV